MSLQFTRSPGVGGFILILGEDLFLSLFEYRDSSPGESQKGEYIHSNIPLPPCTSYQLDSISPEGGISPEGLGELGRQTEEATYLRVFLCGVHYLPLVYQERDKDKVSPPVRYRIFLGGQSGDIGGLDRDSIPGLGVGGKLLVSSVYIEPDKLYILASGDPSGLTQFLCKSFVGEEYIRKRPYLSLDRGGLVSCLQFSGVSKDIPDILPGDTGLEESSFLVLVSVRIEVETLLIENLCQSNRDGLEISCPPGESLQRSE